ncbi:MAG: GNAT family N-acetyltransferase [Dehalococcoidia bacterium]
MARLELGRAGDLMFQREQVSGVQPRLRNVPMRPRQWEDLLSREDVTSVALEDGSTLALVPSYGQICLYYTFADEETGRLHFAELWAELEDDIEEDGWPYTRVDLVELPNRTWIEALLHAADFRPFGEWMEMERRELSEDMEPPFIPEGVQLRRGNEDDHEAIIAIEAVAYSDDADGAEAMDLRLDQAAWIGVVEDGDEVVGYAVNAPAEGLAGRVASLAVHPDHWGNGLGRVLLEAAAYQMAQQGASRAVVELNPLIGAAIRAATGAGFRPGRRGVELRRPTDQATRDELRESERHTGVKARFGSWR